MAGKQEPRSREGHAPVRRVFRKRSDTGTGVAQNICENCGKKADIRRTISDVSDPDSSANGRRFELVIVSGAPLSLTDASSMSGASLPGGSQASIIVVRTIDKNDNCRENRRRRRQRAGSRGRQKFPLIPRAREKPYQLLISRHRVERVK